MGHRVRGAGQYFEIVGWSDQQKAKKPGAPWIMLYTSLMRDEDFADLDDPSRLLLLYLYMLAGVAGRAVFPADASWLFRQIPLLDDKPDLEPLLASRRHSPHGWIRLCKIDGTPIHESKGDACVAPTSEIKDQKSTHIPEQSRAEDSRAEQSSAQACDATRFSSAIGATRTEGESREGARAEASPSPGVVASSTPLPPIVAESLQSPEFDGLSRGIRRLFPGPEALRRAIQEPQRIGKSWPDPVRSLIDPLRAQWVTGIFRALRLPYSPDSYQGHRDLGALCSLYDKLRDALVIPEERRLLILQHDLEEAQRLGKRRKMRHTNLIAVWTKIHNNRVLKYLPTGPPK